MATIDDYLNLITSAWRDKPNFTATISAVVSVPVQVQSLMLQMITTLFDLDLAVGNQLDILGQWIGVSRIVFIPIPGVYFSWDDSEFVGWDYGIWQGTFDPTDIIELPDDVYRTLLKAKIAANHWDGTTTGAYDIWDFLFPDLIILIQDRQDMSYDLAFYGGIIDSLTLALITGGYLTLKPEAVKQNVFFIPIDSGPLFGWDLDSTYVKGWDTGSWAREVFPV